MISPKILATLQAIKEQEDKQGIATAPQINVYQHRTTLYQVLDKLKEIEAIEQQTAASTQNVQKTYTTTEFGRKLLEKMENTQRIK